MARPRQGPLDSLWAFTKWLAAHPVAGDDIYSGSSVRYQVARYCEFLQSNPWSGGDPLREARERDRAMDAYRVYLETFNTSSEAIVRILESLDHFYVFLGLGSSRP
jgi:hypothetical protein